LVFIGEVVDEFLDMVECGFFFTEFVLDHLDILADFNHMAS
jgi:hypothetical protein